MAPTLDSTRAAALLAMITQIGAGDFAVAAPAPAGDSLDQLGAALAELGRQLAEAQASEHTIELAAQQLAQASTPAELLESISAYPRQLGANSTSFFLVHTASSGAPDSVELVASWRARGTADPLGSRYAIADMPLAAIWLAQSDQPSLIGDTAAESALDPQLRTILLQMQHRALAVLPLAIRGRWLGVLVFGWTAPHHFNTHERRILTTLMRQSATSAEALRNVSQSQQTLQTVLDQLPIGVFIVEAGTGAPQHVNRTGIELIGRAPDRSQGSGRYSARYQLYYPGTDTPIPEREISLFKTLATGQPLTEAIDIQRADGRVTVEVRTAPIHNEQGELVSAVAIYQDVTEQRQTELALRRSEERARMLTSATLEGLVFHEQGVIRDLNPAMAELVGYAPSEMLGHSVLEFLAAECHAQVLTNMRSGYDQPYEAIALRKDGSHLLIEVVGREIIGAAGERMRVTAVRDLTLRKQAEAALRQGLLQEETIRAQNALLAELSTPLIPLNDRVLVMPLIGALDTRRAQDVLETLLSGLAGSRAEIAILDITGVPIVDTQVANGLVRAAQAARLLGAEVVLTGIRPEVAQTLVGLDANLQGITTHSTLQSAIASVFAPMRPGKPAATPARLA